MGQAIVVWMDFTACEAWTITVRGRQQAQERNGQLRRHLPLGLTAFFSSSSLHVVKPMNCVANVLL